MIFGIREKRAALGRFTSATCDACKSGKEYAFIRKTKYLVIFFINLIPLKTTYESVCKECDDMADVDTEAGQRIVRKYFSGENAKRSALDAAKIIAALVIIAAAVLLPVLLVRIPVATPAELKALVDEDGTYNILQEDGTVLGTVTVTDGEKTLSFYDHIRVLKGDNSTEGSFLMHEHYYEQVDEETGAAELERLDDDPGVLQDQYLTDVRTYYYDLANDALGYYRGVVDLSTIAYSDDKVVYPYVYYLNGDEPEQYSEVLYLTADKQVRVTFIDTGSEDSTIHAVTIEVAGMDDQNRPANRSIYQFDDDTITLAETAGLTTDSTIDAILDFIDTNALSPTQSMTYTYYGDTSVFTQTDYTQPDTSGAMQTVTQEYTITEKDDYYIMEAVEE